ncbi:hypothetical protein PBAL39_02032 [Pedobacter sp. BAL39]|uniref:DoxX family protein n=1 Tax=Pedobacter sp. BAL39 TaxID=391596 RepID=UPI0001559C95|nr:membrane protein [Pedobacter sp. BAL39]EDM38355.1 hypothetical protein PBAL39_02032 [Pedobacter sp. BAL39]
METIKTNNFQKAVRITLSLFMIFAGIGHLTFSRAEFLAQVPDWVPLGKDFIVLASGVVEMLLGLALFFRRQQIPRIGLLLGIFFLLVFPGNIAQYLNGTDAFGLDTDVMRLIRLFFQPILIFCALWSTGAIAFLRMKKKHS